ncbi:hypothetical protein [Marinilabilia rubra]|uniref:Uncharacterized protein n=1 Tax=Marinilabilia rubra TaxID=2162893 RepID=A0A2U2B6Q9_9BACT|nr:hypothetical protein [Marinilabilia rubra]PWD98761.1 hypothetical protein DDZ16_13560 [Marinilabilia rubra]
MASIRDLKKDINYLASEIVTEAYVRKMLFDGISEDQFKKVITDAIEFRNDLIAKINHPDGKDNPKKVKSFFRDVRKEMDQKSSELIDAVNNLK